MDLTSQAGLDALALFNKELSGLKGDALLKKKTEFDALPEAQRGELDFRLAQKLSLEAALQHEFGLGKWQTALVDYQVMTGRA